jgi:hypothetical protein
MTQSMLLGPSQHEGPGDEVDEYSDCVTMMTTSNTSCLENIVVLLARRGVFCVHVFLVIIRKPRTDRDSTT